MNWLPATWSLIGAMFCWWVLRESEKVTWSRPSAAKYLKLASWSFTARSLIWRVNYSARKTQAGEGRLLSKYLKPDLLIIDDMGLKVLPQKSGEILLEIIMRRYEKRSTMMTSNRPIEEWGKLLNDVPAASAILDRLLHHAEIIPINGRSYRLQSKARRAAAPERSASSTSSPNPA
jgi:DNA replication protein DnaC